MMLIIVITCIGAVSLCGAALVHMHVYRNFPTSIHPSIHPSSLLSLLSFYLLNKYSVGSRSLLDWQPLRTPQKSLFLSHSGPLLAELSLHLWPSWTSPFFGPFSIFTSPSLCLYFSPRLHVSVLVYPLVFFFFVFFFSFSRNASFYHLFPAFLNRPKHIFVQNDLVVELWSAAGPVGMTYFLRLISLSESCPAFVSFFFFFFCFCFPLFLFRVGPQQGYLCFAHLSPHYLLCHGTVNVSDRDRSCWKSTPSFVLCLFCYPSLTRFLFISGRRAGPGLYLVAKFTHWKGRKASNKQLRYS